MDYLDKHLIIELYNCETDRAGDPHYIEKILKEVAITPSNKTINSFFHKFDESGVVGFILLSNGSYNIRTWVKEAYVGLDIHTPNTETENEKIVEFLLRKFGATKYSASEIKRGIKLEE